MGGACHFYHLLVDHLCVQYKGKSRVKMLTRGGPSVVVQSLSNLSFTRCTLQLLLMLGALPFLTYFVLIRQMMYVRTVFVSS
jgi:hypothetical protein